VERLLKTGQGCYVFKGYDVLGGYLDVPHPKKLPVLRLLGYIYISYALKTQIQNFIHT
jgi:hypothetical protein